MERLALFSGDFAKNHFIVVCERNIGGMAEELFKKDMNLKPVHPHSYFGLALLYRVTGHPEESFKALERLLILLPKTPGIEGQNYRYRFDG
jgi:hypothetical protein